MGTTSCWGKDRGAFGAVKTRGLKPTRSADGEPDEPAHPMTFKRDF
jgi:hypothetical protein